MQRSETPWVGNVPFNMEYPAPLILEEGKGVPRLTLVFQEVFTVRHQEASDGTQSPASGQHLTMSLQWEPSQPQCAA